LGGCDKDPDAPAAVSGMGLVIQSDDPAHAGLSPEELEARRIRLYFHDFGRVPLGETARHVFRLKNTNSEPVAITRMQPSCSCTSAELVFEAADGRSTRIRSSARDSAAVPIPPGATAELAFTLNTEHSEPTSHNTDKLYSVHVATTSPKRGFLRFEAHVYIERAFQATPQPLDLQRISINGGGTGTVDLIRVGTSGARLVGVGPLPPGVRASIVEESMLGSPLWKLAITLEPPVASGPILQRFELMAEDPEGLPYPSFPIEVHAYGVLDVDWSPQRLLLRNASIDRGMEASVEIYSLLAGDRLLVTSARLAGDGTDKLDLKVAPDLRDANGRSERWTLTLTPKQPFGEEIVRGKAVVELEGRDPIEIDVLVHPR
jgi:hypothetical protein